MLGPMYNVALSVTACRRAGTRVDVAWPLSTDGLPFDPSVDALALTPGGGRVGGILGGALDLQLSDLAQRQASTGRVVDLTVNDVDATVAGLPHGGQVRCALVPAQTLPDEVWPLLLDRQPVCLVSTLAGDELTATTVYLEPDIATAPDPAPEAFRQGRSTVVMTEDLLVTVLRPVPRLVVTGGGPIADALAAAAPVLGWQVVVEPDPQTAAGLMATLSPLDSVLVIGHDVEASSRVLGAALESPVGYLGALGSRAMQQQRADWLAYRDVTDLSRVHGPAGLDIGAQTPGEIAVAILAEAVEAHRRR
jgi:xanthine dehydrogenase accessory factor